MQTARGFIGFAREFPPCVQRAQDHFERGFVGEFRVRINRDAPPVVADCDRVVFVQFDFDPCGVSCDRFVHGVVEHFGHKVVQRAFIGAADVHARTQPDRFEPFKDLDRGCVVVGGGFGSGEEIVGHMRARLVFD